jgi:predicted 2-oxoglutarate/Fe(II)-dependent dioxygenase YbiX
VVEHWRYRAGGGLVDDLHYDVDSIITIVACLSDDPELEGGVFRTFESSGEMLDHPMARGDVICLLSHKYHNVTTVTQGIRKSMVVEMWQGGSQHTGR